MPPVYRARHCRRRDRTDSQRRTHGRRRQHTTVDLPGSLTIRVIRTLFAADAQVANWHSTVRLWPERRFSVAAGTTDLGGEKAFEMAWLLGRHERERSQRANFTCYLAPDTGAAPNPAAAEDGAGNDGGRKAHPEKLAPQDVEAAGA